MNSNKLTYLLQQFKLDSQIVKSPEELGKVLNSEIDYNTVNNIIKNEQVKSVDYLKKQLG